MTIQVIMIAAVAASLVVVVVAGMRFDSKAEHRCELPHTIVFRAEHRKLPCIPCLSRHVSSACYTDSIVKPKASKNKR